MTITSCQPDALDHANRGRIIATAAGLATLTLVLRWPFLGHAGFPPDQTQFIQWSLIARDAGVAALYAPAEGASTGPLCNYPPVYPLMLRGMAEVAVWTAPPGARLDQSTLRRIAAGEAGRDEDWIRSLYKWPGVLTDAILVVVVFVCLARRGRWLHAALAAAALAVAPVMIHNSAIWGQMDSILALFIVLSLESALRRRLAWMAGWAALAILTKPQALAFAPLWLMTAWPDSREQARESARAAAVFLILCLVILLPVWSELNGVWQTYAGAAGRYPYTHLNGFSAWFVADPLSAPHLAESLSRWYVRDDTVRAAGLPARAWGMAGVLSLWLLVGVDLNRRRGNPDALRRAAALLPLGFFLFATQMHERYLLMSVAAWAWAGPVGWRGWTAWITLAIVASINACWAWPGPPSGWWTDACAAALHRDWLGRPCGYWCSLALVLVFAAAISSRRMWTEHPQDSSPPS